MYILNIYLFSHKDVTRMCGLDKSVFYIFDFLFAFLVNLTLMEGQAIDLVKKELGRFYQDKVITKERETVTLKIQLEPLTQS